VINCSCLRLRIALLVIPAVTAATACSNPALIAGAAAKSAPIQLASQRRTVTPGPFATLLFSRSEANAADGCVPDSKGIARLVNVVAPFLESLGMRGTGSLVTGKTQPTVPLCTHHGDSLAASWADAASLAENYGWSFVSATATYPSDISKLSPAKQYAETCGSAATIDQHNLPGGHGLIAYPGKQGLPVQVQSTYGAECFAWGRTFSKSGTTDEAAGSTPPYWQSTEAVLGGPCNDRKASCYTISATGSTRYDLPSKIITQVKALQPGQWFTLQAYILVRGTNPPYASNGTRWDCTSPNPALHWTNDVERYCYSDWKKIVRAIAAVPGITVTDPLTVGVAFGRPSTYPEGDGASRWQHLSW
jgi:hypothetical protein